MSTRPDDFSRAAGVVLIEDPTDRQLLAVNDWLTALEEDEPTELQQPAAITLEELRHEDSA